MKRIIATVCGLLTLSACGDNFFTDPARAPSAVQVAYSLASTNNGAAFDKANRITYEVALGTTISEDPEIVAQGTQDFVPSAETRVRVPVEIPEGTHDAIVALVLEHDGAELFFGFAVTKLTSGEANTVQIQLVPIVHSIQLPTTLRTLTAVNDTVTVVATPLFATGDIVTGTPCTFASNNVNIADVNATTGRVVARGSGTTTIRVICGDEESTIPVTVNAPTGNGVISGIVRDLQTLAPLNATIVLTNDAGQPVRTATGTSYSFTNLPIGAYSLQVTAAGHQTHIAGAIAGGNALARSVINFDLPSTTFTAPVGGVAGVVTSVNTNGAAIAGATVQISGGAQTNGVFRSTTTDANGAYSLSGITLTAANGAPITNFTLIVTAPGFRAETRTLALTANRTSGATNVPLQPGTANSFFTETFEAGSAGWTTTGLWNRTNGFNIRNTAVPTYVTLPPDDNSTGLLPVQGGFYMWYGSPSTGNFIGTQIANDAPLDGGTSVSPNTGTVTSPAITIPSTAPAASLNLRTWFEIESVSPNQDGFDIMTISVQNVSTGVITELQRLNPFVDPEVDTNRESLAFTSAGFNRAPTFRTVSINLNAFRGSTVRVIFRFDTVDNQYNGFRGWIIDDIRVTDEVATSGVMAAPPPANQPRPVRLERRK